MNEEKMELEAFGNSNTVGNSSKRSSKPSSPTSSSDQSEEKEDDLINSIALVQWAVCGQNRYKPVSSTFEKLSSGVYSISVTQYHGIVYDKKDIRVDNLLRFPDSISDKILEEITTFWKKGDKFAEHGFLHRRGFLLHGPAGSGKSCLVQQIMADIINSGGIVFQLDNHPNVFKDGLAQFRKVEPNRPIVCLMEDIDAIIDEHGEDDILSMLDGENQIDKVLNIGTTNYPEKLDRRLVARPRRFDRVIKIGMPNDRVRRMYFQKKLNISETELDVWVKSTDGFSFASCAELVISVKCFEKNFESSVEILRDMMTATIPNSREYNGENVGFKV